MNERDYKTMDEVDAPFDASGLHVLIPNSPYGVSVCTLVELLGRDEKTLDELITNAAMDSAMFPDEIPRLIERVWKLNATGDVDAYWAETK